ncbi:MAG: hypothetical protein Q9211_004481 [Gyalolechia sp. 1 TL-2023]
MELRFNSICTFPLPTDLFALAVHGNSPVVAIGLASGHVQLQRLPAPPPNSSTEAKANTPSTNGYGTIETAWRTRRHKGSCRSLAFTTDYVQLLSAGSDGIVKAAATETGQVSGKIAVPRDPNGKLDPPTLLHALSPQSLLLATDSSALHIYDLRSNNAFAGAKPQQTHHPHYDYISSITPLTPSETSTSGYSRQWFSTGGSTTAVTDIRKGVVFESGDFEEELFSSTLAGGADHDRIVTGGEKGALRMWEGGLKGVIKGKEKKLTIAKGESLDVTCSVPASVVEGDVVAVGLGDGTVSFAQTNHRRTGVVGRMRHDEVDGVMAIDFDPDGRLISGGGSIVKVWEKNIDHFSDDEDSSDNEGEDLIDPNGTNDGGSKGNSDEESDDESSEEERPKRKKRKRNKGKDRGKMNHIMAFKGMD